MSRWLRCGVLAAALAAGAVGCGRPEPTSVVLIVVDTLRADHLGLYGHRRPTSPRIDAWATGGAVFERAFSTSPWTLPAFGSMLTGHLPSRHRAGGITREADGDGARRRSFLRLDPELETLAEKLSAGGRDTAAVVSNAFLHPRFGLDRGFRLYDFMASNRSQIRPADVAVDRALEWLAEIDPEPFFLLLHLFDPHIDYDPAPAVRGTFSERLEPSPAPRVTDLQEVRRRLRRGEPVDGDYLRALYDEEILFVDRQVGRFLDALAERGIDRRTLVVFTSDHGEEFFEHGGFEHGHSVFDELVRVPLVMRGPGIPARRLEQSVSLIDLYPTLLEAAGLEAPPDLPGRSLLPLVGGATGEPQRLILSEHTLYGAERRAALRWPYKLIHSLRGDQVMLFDLDRDPGETRDLSRRRRAATQNLYADLTAALDATGGAAAGEEVELDAETLESLRSLGYID